MVKLPSTVLCLSALLLSAIGEAASNPWFGTWKLRLSNAAKAPETLVYSDAGGGAMRMVSVEEGSELITRFDGKPAIVRKPSGSGAHSLAIRATSPTSYSWLYVRAGKPDVRGTNMLAPDRRSFTEVSWHVTDPAKRTTLVYDRQ